MVGNTTSYFYCILYCDWVFWWWFIWLYTYIFCASMYYLLKFLCVKFHSVGLGPAVYWPQVFLHLLFVFIAYDLFAHSSIIRKTSQYTHFYIFVYIWDHNYEQYRRQNSSLRVTSTFYTFEKVLKVPLYLWKKGIFSKVSKVFQRYFCILLYIFFFW